VYKQQAVPSTWQTDLLLSERGAEREERRAEPQIQIPEPPPTHPHTNAPRSPTRPFN
jgi:hypothetical protein